MTDQGQTKKETKEHRSRQPDVDVDMTEIVREFLKLMEKVEKVSNKERTKKKKAPLESTNTLLSRDEIVLKRLTQKGASKDLTEWMAKYIRLSQYQHGDQLLPEDKPFLKLVKKHQPPPKRCILLEKNRASHQELCKLRIRHLEPTDASDELIEAADSDSSDATLTPPLDPVTEVTHDKPAVPDLIQPPFQTKYPGIVAFARFNSPLKDAQTHYIFGDNSTPKQASGNNKAVGTSDTNQDVETSDTNQAVETSDTNQDVETSGTNKALETSDTNQDVETSGTNKALETSDTSQAVNNCTNQDGLTSTVTASTTRNAPTNKRDVRATLEVIPEIPAEDTLHCNIADGATGTPVDVQPPECNQQQQQEEKQPVTPPSKDTVSQELESTAVQNETLTSCPDLPADRDTADLTIQPLKGEPLRNIATCCRFILRHLSVIILAFVFYVICSQ